MITVKPIGLDDLKVLIYMPSEIYSALINKPTD